MEFCQIRKSGNPEVSSGDPDVISGAWGGAGLAGAQVRCPGARTVPCGPIHHE